MNSVSENKNNQVQLLSDLIRKIRLQRGVHDVYYDRIRKINTSLKIFNIVSSSFITLIVFADFGLIKILLPDLSGFPVMLTVGVISFFIFLLNSIANIFNLGNREVEHLRTIELHSDLLRDIRKSSLNDKMDTEQNELLKSFNERYMQITFSTHNVGGKHFEIAYGKYLRRQAIHLARKEKPFNNRWKIRKRAKDLVKEWQKREGNL